MPSDSPAANAIGLVETKTVDIEQPLVLACGVTLPVHRLAYETYGELNTQRNNGILICHALSGDHHAAGIHAGESRPGWWDHYIGPGKPLDSDKFFIVSVNNIGSCFGSTGPTTINPETGQPWGADFPSLRARDWVESQKLLMEDLNIDCWAAVVGAGSPSPRRKCYCSRRFARAAAAGPDCAEISDQAAVI